MAQFFYNGGQTAINSLFLVYSCTYVGLDEGIATTFFGLYMLAFLLGRWIGTMLMIRFSPGKMLLMYAIVNMVLCLVVTCCGGMIGLYAMLGISFSCQSCILLSSLWRWMDWVSKLSQDLHSW